MQKPSATTTEIRTRLYPGSDVVTVETLEAKFRRLHEDVGTLSVPAGTAWAAKRKLERTDDEGCLLDTLTIGDVYALWVEGRLEEIDDEWSAKVDELIARRPDHPHCTDDEWAAWRKEVQAMDLRRGVRRTATTKYAYGVKYADYVKES